MARKLNNVIKRSTASGESNSPRKLKNVTVNSSALDSLDRNLEDSFNKLQEYQTRRSNNEYMTAEEIAGYRKARDSYAAGSKSLYGITRSQGVNVDADEKQTNDWLAALAEELDNTEKTFSSFKDAEEYNDYQLLVGKTLKDQIDTINDINIKTDRDVDRTTKLFNIAFSNASAEDLKQWYDWTGAGARYDDYISDSARDQLSYWLEVRKAADKYAIDQDVIASFSGLPQNKDWQEKSQYVAPTDSDKYGLGDILTYIYGEEELDDKLGDDDYNITLWDQKYPYVNSHKIETKNSIEAFAYEIKRKINSSKSPSLEGFPGLEDDAVKHLTNSEREKLTYLYNTDVDAAASYLTALTDVLNERTGKQTNARIYQSINSLPGGNTAAYLDMATIGGVYKGVEGAENLVRVVSGKDIESDITDYYAAIRSHQTENMGKVGQLVYDTGVNIGNMVTDMLIANGVLKGVGAIATKGESLKKALTATNSVLTGAGALGRAQEMVKNANHLSRIMMASSTITPAMQSAIDRGLDNNQVFVIGMSAALAEYISEGIGIESFLGNPSHWLRFLVQQAGAEGLEEGVSKGLNTLADDLIAGGSSELNLRMRELIATEDKTQKEAFSQAWTEWIEECGYEMTAGTLAGLIFGAGGSVAMASDSHTVSEEYKGRQQELVDEVLELDGEYEYGKKMKARLDKGKTLSGGQLLQLQKRVNDAIIEKDRITITAAVESRLGELGESGKSISNLAEVITKQVMGEKTSLTERSLIKNSRFGQRVINELKPENIASEEYTTRWSENIGTQRVNAIPYNIGRFIDPVAEKPALQSDEVPAYESFTRTDKGLVYNVTTTEGRDIKVYGVDHDTGKLNTSEGLLDVNSVEFGDKAVSTLYKNANKYEGPVAELYVAAYEPETASVDAYNRAFEGLFKEGSVIGAGLNFERAYKLYGKIGGLDIHTARVIYDAGENETVIKRQAQQKKTAENKKSATPKGITGEVRGSAVEELTEREKAIYETIAKEFKLDIDVVGMTGDDSLGYANTVTRRIVASLATRNKVSTLLHELGHIMKAWAPDSYNEIQDAVVSWYGKKANISIDKMVSERQKLYKEKGEIIDESEALDEITNNALETAQRSKNFDKIFVKSMAEDGYTKTEAQGVLAKLKAFFEKLKNLFRKVSAAAKAENADTSEMITAEGMLISQDVEMVDRMLELLTRGMQEVRENYDAYLRGENQGIVDGVLKLDSPVEEAGNLIALHNITEAQMIAAMKEGSIAGPSISVSESGITKFGEISVVFSKETIDPTVSSENKLYGADAWTPGQTTLKKNAVFDTAKTTDAINEVQRIIGNKHASELFDMTHTQIEDAVRKAKGDVHLAFDNNIGLQTAYALKEGIIATVPENSDGSVNIAKLKEELKALSSGDGVVWGQYRRQFVEPLIDSAITSYDAATVDETVEVMREKPDTAKSFKLTEDGRLTVPAARYRSIEALKKNQHRLSENAEETVKDVGKRFVGYAEGIAEKTNTTTEKVVAAINRAFELRYRAEGIVGSFAEDGISITKNEAENIRNLYKQAVELPSEYFEAKAMRAVPVTEAAAVVAPKSFIQKNTDIVESLRNSGVEVMAYEDGNDSSRLEAIHSVEGVRFQYLEEDEKGLNKREYSYSELVAKKYMEITDVLPVSDSEVNKYRNNGDLFAKDMRKLASAVGNLNNTPTTTYLRCDDLNTDLLITKDSFKHSIGRNDIEATYISICKKMSEILEKAIVVNELKARPGSVGGYVLLGVCQDNDNYIFVRALTEKNTYKLVDYDVLTTITKNKIKKGDVGTKPQAFTRKSGSRSSPAFSITDALEIVKNIPLINSVLSDDVIDKLGVKRIHDPNITPSLKHQHLSSAEQEQQLAAEMQEQIEALKQINKSLTAKNNAQARMIQTLRSEIKQWQTEGGKRLDYNGIQRVARKLISETGSKMKQTELTNKLTNLFNYMATNENPTAEYVKKTMEGIANEIIGSASAVDEDVIERIYFIKSKLGNGIKLNKNQKAEVIEAFDSIQEYKAFVGSTVKISEKGTLLDDIWNELSDKYPDLFTADITDAQQPLEIADVLSRLGENRTYNPFYREYMGEMEHAVADVCRMIIEGYYSVPELISAKAAHRSAYAEAKAEFDKAQKETKEAYKVRLEQIENNYQGALISVEYENRQERERDRKKYKNTLNAIVYENRQKYADYREARALTEEKNRVKKLMKTLSSTLANPTKTRYAPVEVFEAVVKVCKAIDLGHNLDTKIGQYMAHLQRKYLEMLDNEEILADYKSEFSERIYKNLNTITNNLGDRSIAELSYKEMYQLRTALEDVTHTLVEARKQIGTEEFVENYGLAMQMIKELDEAPDASKLSKLVAGAALNPMNAAEMMSGYNPDSIIMQLFDRLRKGERARKQYYMEAHRAFDELMAEKEYKEFITKEFDVGLYDANGHRVMLTKAEMAQIIMSWEREQTSIHLNHLNEGGVKIPDLKLLKKGRVTEALNNSKYVRNITVGDIQNMREQMDEYSKRWMSVSREYFNGMSRKAVNDVSMKLLHRITATAGDYIPFEVDDNFRVSEIQALHYNKLLENAGILKSITPGARQPLVIMGLNICVDRNIDTMAKLKGLAIPLRDVQKVYNTIGMKEDHGVSVKQAIEKNGWNGFGTPDQKGNLFEQVMIEMQAGRQPTEHSELYDRLRGNQIKAILSYKISAALKNMTAYTIAGSKLSTKALAAGIVKTPRRYGNMQALFDEIDKYTPLHYMRRVGLSTPELTAMTDLKKTRGTYFRGENWIKGMDVLVTASLWEACKAEIDGKLNDYKITKGSAAYFKRVSDLYNEVIEETQQSNDILFKSEMQRSKNFVLQQATLFKTDMFVNYNILHSSLARRNATKDMVKNAKTEAEKNNAERLYNQAKKTLGKAISSQLIGNAVLTLLTFIGNGLLRHKLDKYRDKEGDVSAEGVLSEMLEIFLGTAAETVTAPVSAFFDWAGYVESLITGDKFYENEDLVSGMVSDLTTGTTKLWSTLKPMWDDDPDNKVDIKKTEDTVLDILTSTASVFGVPAGNIKDILQATVLYGQDIFTDEKLFDAGYEMSNKEKTAKVTELVEGEEYKTATEYVKKWVEDKALELAEKDGYKEKKVVGYIKTKYQNDAKSDIRGYFTALYKEKYLDAVEEKDVKTVKKIRVILYNTRLYAEKDKNGNEINDIDSVFTDWRKAAFEDEYKEAYKTAYGTGDTKTMERIEAAVRASEFYDKPNTTLKNWRNAVDQLNSEAEG